VVFLLGSKDSLNGISCVHDLHNNTIGRSEDNSDRIVPKFVPLNESVPGKSHVSPQVYFMGKQPQSCLSAE